MEDGEWLTSSFVCIFFVFSATRSLHFPACSFRLTDKCKVCSGDGIGPENFDHVQRIFTFAHVPVDFETVKLSSELAHDDLTNAIISIRRNGVALKVCELKREE